MSFLIKNFNGHAGVCLLNRTTSAASDTWVVQGGTFSPVLINGAYVTVEGGFRYFVTWNWASSNTTTAIIQRYFTVIRATELSSLGSTAIQSRPSSSTYLGTYSLQHTEATAVFDAPCDCEIQIGSSYECPSSSLLIWRFPL